MRWLIILLVVLLPFTAAAKKLTVQPEDVNSITVLAPTSLAVPISELCKLYSLKTANDVNAVFDSEGESIRNIEEGDPADLVIIPSQKFFADLEHKGLIDGSTKKVLAKNGLSIVGAKNFPIFSEPNSKLALNQIYNKTLMIIADKEDDALGDYTFQSLAKMGLWDRFSSRVILAPNSSSVVDLVIKGQSAGIVFTSDAKLFAKDLNTIAVIPNAMHKSIEYIAAVVVGEDMAQAKDFLNFLASKEAANIFKKHGFVIQ